MQYQTITPMSCFGKWEIRIIVIPQTDNAGQPPTSYFDADMLLVSYFRLFPIILAGVSDLRHVMQQPKPLWPTDTIVSGLTFRVSAETVSHPEGRRDWLLRYRPRRQKQRAVALGTYPSVSVSKARERAGEIVAVAKRGVDLIAAEERDAEVRRAAEAKARPLREIANAYLESVKHLRSWRDIESRMLRRYMTMISLSLQSDGHPSRTEGY